jgi:flagellar M-ring protein FliF
LALPDFVKAIGAARFGVMAGVAAALTAFFLYVAGALSEPPKSILYSGLEQRDASAVVAKLDTLNVKYEAKDDGATIMVPADQVTKLRMQLAQENLPAAGVGYEIFDKSDTFGATAFVQNINRLRALEGELARSIRTIEGMESVRVHLVVPEREIFSRDAQSPSGSVVIKTRGTLGREQVAAVQHLVAAAVAGLKPARVAIIDDKGNLLAGGDDKTGADALAADQEASTTTYEDRLRQRIESIVEGIAGQGKARVQVTANIDYKQINETSDIFDPDSKVVRSTTTTEANSSDANGSAGVSVGNALPGGAAQTGPDSTRSTTGNTEEITNYEINKTTRNSVDNNAVVKKLSVAVAVDGVVTDAGGYKPRSAKEMQQIDALVKSAIGFDAARGDQVQVVNMPFAHVDTTVGTPAAEPLLGLDGAAWFKIIEAAILCITALLIGLFVLRPLIVRMFSTVPANYAEAGVAGALSAPGEAGAAIALPGGGGGEGQPGLEPPKENMIDISRIEGQVRESSIRKVGEVVDAHPEEAVAIIRSWIHQPS